MPFIIPLERTKVSTRTTFSKYKLIEESEFFILQKRKRTFRSDSHPTYRIITQNRPFFELAQGYHLEEFQSNEWDYMIHYLPKILPPHLPPKDRQSWLIAHFTQLALEHGADMGHKDGQYNFNFRGKEGKDSDDEGEPHRQPPSTPTGSSTASRKSSSPRIHDTDLSTSRGTGTDQRRGRTVQATQKPNPSNRYLTKYYQSAMKATAYPENLSMLVGRKLAVALTLVNLCLWLLVRDCSTVVFGVLVFTCSVLIFHVVSRGEPVTIGIILHKHNQAQTETKSPVTNSAVSRTPTGKDIRKARFSVSGRTREIGSEDITEGEQGEDECEHERDLSEAETQNRADSSASDKETSGTEEKKCASSEPSPGPPIPGGHTLTYVTPGEKLPTNSWSTADATTFKVRAVGYLKTKKKQNSEESFYQSIGADIFSTSCKVNHVMRFLSLPPEPKAEDAESEEKRKIETEHVPPWIVINFQFPGYAPSNPVWGAPAIDGKGFSFVSFFYIEDSTRVQLASKSPTPQIALLKRWFDAHHNGDPEQIRKRLKAIPRVCGIDDLNIGMVLKRTLNTYNEKPFMTGPRCHSFYLGPNYIEIDIDYHKFCYMARQGAWQFYELAQEMVVDLAFVIQGDQDTELPEQVVACVRVAKLQECHALSLEETRNHFLKRGLIKIARKSLSSLPPLSSSQILLSPTLTPSFTSSSMSSSSSSLSGAPPLGRSSSASLPSAYEHSTTPSGSPLSSPRHGSQFNSSTNVPLSALS